MFGTGPALHSASTLPSSLNTTQEQANEDTDDGNDYQQFNKSKTGLGLVALNSMHG